MLSMPRIVRPDPDRLGGQKLVSPLDRQLAGPLSETKNWRKLLAGEFSRQIDHIAIFTGSVSEGEGQDCFSVTRFLVSSIIQPNTAMPIRIAMWSGPRNISTAMMRAWSNRPDTFVVDEPFYAFYLNETHANHPGAEEVIQDGETDWRRIVARLTGPVPSAARIFYQKQMTHHLLPQVDRDWLGRVMNCFLIRDPAEVIASYLKKNHEPSVEDLGFVQQTEIFGFVQRRTGSVPIVIDAEDVLRDPQRMLRLLCDALGLEFSDAMLSWPSGRRETDGVWAKHWYAEVESSTSFQPYRERRIKLPEHLRGVYERCREVYEQLYAYRLR